MRFPEYQEGEGEGNIAGQRLALVEMSDYLTTNTIASVYEGSNRSIWWQSVTTAHECNSRIKTVHKGSTVEECVPIQP